MTKKKSTKRALISSMLILAMCFTMLAGTTFAWFTDSVTSANNIIKSGKLDMGVQYWDGQAWADLDNTVKLFADDALYEPGYTQVAYIKIANLGNLALKYALSANIVSETAGVSAAGSFKLSDYLMFGTAETNAVYGDRDEARQAVATSAKALKELNANNAGYLLAGAESGIIALVIYMPETVGNEANYTTTAPEIALGINVVATQKDYEADGFDETYDALAELPAQKIVSTGADFTAALGNNEVENVTLSEDIAVSGPQTVSGQTVDGGGNTITISNTGSDCGLNAQSGTIENVTIEGSGRGIGTGSSGTYKMDGDLYLNNVTVDGPTYGINIGKGEGNKLIATDCTINGWNSMDDVEGTFTNCTFGKASQGSGANYAVWAIYDTITFNSCTFKDGYQFFGRSTTTGVLTLNNCTHDGVAVTAANFASLFDAVHDSDFDYIKNQMTVYVDGVQVVF